MRLADLTREIERSPGAVTIPDLAARLEATPTAVKAMLVALRASGRLGPEGSRQADPGTSGDGAGCTLRGSCAGACPGPASCPFVVDLVTGLEPRRR